MTYDQLQRDRLERLTFVMVDFPESQYFKESTNKRQIVLHHTASGRGAKGDHGFWASTKGRIATSMIIDHNGVIHQCFNSQYFGYHIGSEHENNYWLQKHSIGVELDSWGGLTKKDGKFYSWADVEVEPERVVEYQDGFRGYQYFERYTDEQLESLRILLLYLCDKWNIPKGYNVDMWNYCLKPLNKIPGIWTHVSYREDKSDCHPQYELKDKLINLEVHEHC